MALDFKEDKEIFSLKVDDVAKAYLLETMRWTKFIGILFSIFLILMCLVFAFVMFVYMPGLQTPVPNAGLSVTLMSIAMLGFNFYPIFALLRFSSLVRKAIESANQHEFNHALKYLKNLFRYIGIFTIIIIVIYGLGFGLGLMGR